jgi:hypothetical protein
MLAAAIEKQQTVASVAAYHRIAGSHEQTHKHMLAHNEPLCCREKFMSARAFDPPRLRRLDKLPMVPADPLAQAFDKSREVVLPKAAA